MTSRQKPISLTGPRWLIGLSKIAYGSALGCLKNLQKLQTNEFRDKLEPGSKDWVDGVKEDECRCLFDQLLCIFHKESYGSDCFWPLHLMLGDGKSVDLLKLCLLVKEKGGYETVSTEGLWDCVAKESGLGSDIGYAVKLAYDLHLYRLGGWLQRIVEDKDSKGGLQDSSADLSGCLMDLEPEFSGFSSRNSNQKKRDGEYRCLDLEESYLDSKDVGNLCNGNEVLDLEESDEGRKCVEDTTSTCEGEDNMISDSPMFSNRKRKRECQWRMLDWVVDVAKNPCHPEIELLPERPNWKHYGSEQLWKQVLLFREATFLKRNVNISAAQTTTDWLKQKMHPSLYDDRSGSERLRSSQRFHSTKESRALSSKIRARSTSDSSSCARTELEDHLDRESETLSADSVFVFLDDNNNRKRVPVGPFFQATVPEWTGETYESDSRWLGSRVWPLESGEHAKYVIERDRIGKGRQDSCGCQHPGSVECVRFHIAEKRMRVKLELGLAFQRMKFDKMGEEVAISWTKEEEKRFQEIIKSNPPSLDKCFWNEIVKSFPSKKRGDLVSYYFNVFLLQRRGYQNRSTPSNVDSDDEDSEFGSLTSRFKNEASKSPGSIFRSPKKPRKYLRQ